MSSTASSSSEPKQMPGNTNVGQASKILAGCLGNRQYAIVGGGALALLGSDRETDGVDFVVPKGETPSIRALLKEQPEHFTVERRTNHTTYNSKPPVAIQILTPPALFKMAFDVSTPTIQIDNVKVLKPTLILCAKIDSILSRVSDGKIAADANDIKYLLRWCTTEEGRRHGCTITAKEVPNATRNFYLGFVSTYREPQLWTNAGFNLQTGRFP